MSHDFFFGYGSLVNRATHDFPEAHPARVTGWRRAWRHTDLRPVAYLTAEPAAAARDRRPRRRGARRRLGRARPPRARL